MKNENMVQLNIFAQRMRNGDVKIALLWQLS